jgi:hypothetical protein
MRRFKLIRSEDETGISGTGHIADGVLFGNGRVVLSWKGVFSSTAIFNGMNDMLAVHGHGGKTTPEWIDEP